MLITAAMAAEEAAGAHGGGASFPPFDSSTYSSQVFWLALSFGLFYYFMSRTALPRISSIIETRNDRIAHDLDQAASMKAEADAAVAAYEQELADARSKAGDIADKARANAKQDAAAERSKAEEVMAKQLATAEADIAASKAKALAEVDGIAADTASELVKALIGGSVTKASITSALKSVKG